MNWQNIEYRSDELAKLPKYYLSDHIELWKALSSTYRTLEEGLDIQQGSQDDVYVDDALNKLKSLWTELKTIFAPGALRDLILKRFTYIQNPSPIGANTFILSSRCAKFYDPRIQLYYHSDTTLEAFNDGFFIDANGKLSQGWSETLASQDFKAPKRAWKKSMNLGLRILMARCGTF